MKQPIVLYFSSTGHTAAVAQRLATAHDAILVPVRPQTPYTAADRDWHDATSRTSVESNDATCRPAIQSIDDRLLATADAIYLGAPLWWGQMPRVVNTLLEAHDFHGRPVWTFCTSSSTPIHQAVRQLRTDYPTINWQGGQRFTRRTTAVEVQRWLGDSDR